MLSHIPVRYCFFQVSDVLLSKINYRVWYFINKYIRNVLYHGKLTFVLITLASMVFSDCKLYPSIAALVCLFFCVSTVPNRSKDVMSRSKCSSGGKTFLDDARISYL